MSKFCKLCKVGCMLLTLFFVTSLFTNYHAEEKSFSKNDFVQVVKNSPTFLEYENRIISDIGVTPIQEEFDDNHLVGYHTYLEVNTFITEDIPSSVNENLTYKVTTTIRSLLLFQYVIATNELKTYLIDYSNIENANQVTIKDLTSGFEVPIDNKLLPKSLDRVGENISYDKSSMIIKSENRISTMALPQNNCMWLVCTERKQGGGNWDGLCTMIGSGVCGAPISTLASLPIYLVCQAGVVVGCYTPSYDVCVNWYWQTKFCPTA